MQLYCGAQIRAAGAGTRPTCPEFAPGVYQHKYGYNLAQCNLLLFHFALIISSSMTHIFVIATLENDSVIVIRDACGQLAVRQTSIVLPCRTRLHIQRTAQSP